MTVTEKMDQDGSADSNADLDSAASDSHDADSETSVRKDKSKSNASHRHLSISLRALAIGLVLVAFAAATGALAWWGLAAQHKLEDQARATENNKRAEQIALDYAVNAAAINYRDFGTWKVKLVEGTSPELKEKLGKAADSMEQILVPLQWNSSARPLAAKVRSNAGGAYVVDSFVSVLTKTTQAPEGLQSTATYSVTIDANHGWQITDVGGLDAIVGSG